MPRVRARRARTDATKASARSRQSAAPVQQVQGAHRASAKRLERRCMARPKCLAARARETVGLYAPPYVPSWPRSHERHPRLPHSRARQASRVPTRLERPRASRRGGSVAIEPGTETRAHGAPRLDAPVCVRARREAPSGAPSSSTVRLLQLGVEDGLAVRELTLADRALFEP
jgi:hypothetical protein